MDTVCEARECLREAFGALQIVAHRGLHDVDNCVHRPLENTLPALEAAWKNFDFCHCDVTCSLDGELYLCADRTFAKLAHPMQYTRESALAAKAEISTLTAAQIDSIILKDSRTRPTRLLQVLQFLQIVNDPRKRLMIQIYSGEANSALLAKKLKEILAVGGREEEDFAHHVAAVSSFDLKLLRHFVKWKQMAVISGEINLVMLISNEDASAEKDFATQLVHFVEKNELDGVFLQYRTELVATRTRMAALRNIRQQNVRVLGIWNTQDQNPRFDGLNTGEDFSQCGVDFCYSDLPQRQLEEIGLVEPLNDEEEHPRYWWHNAKYTAKWWGGLKTE